MSTNKVYPKVHYKKGGFIVLGCPAWIEPIDHPDTVNVTNQQIVRTTPVQTIQYHNNKIVAFFTKNTHYILETK